MLPEYLFALADSSEALGTHAARGPNSFISMQFSAKNLQNNRLAHPFWGKIIGQHTHFGSQSFTKKSLAFTFAISRTMLHPTQGQCL